MVWGWGGTFSVEVLLHVAGHICAHVSTTWFTHSHPHLCRFASAAVYAACLPAPRGHNQLVNPIDGVNHVSRGNVRRSALRAVSVRVSSGVCDDYGVLLRLCLSEATALMKAMTVRRVASLPSIQGQMVSCHAATTPGMGAIAAPPTKCCERQRMPAAYSFLAFPECCLGC